MYPCLLVGRLFRDLFPDLLTYSEIRIPAYWWGGYFETVLLQGCLNSIHFLHRIPAYWWGDYFETCDGHLPLINHPVSIPAYWWGGYFETFQNLCHLHQNFSTSIPSYPLKI